MNTAGDREVGNPERDKKKSLGSCGDEISGLCTQNPSLPPRTLSITTQSQVKQRLKLFCSKDNLSLLVHT